MMLTLLLLLVVVAVVVGAYLFAIGFVLFVLFAAFTVSYLRTRRLVNFCPNCGGKHISLSMTQAGYSGGGVMVGWFGGGSIAAHHQNMATCSDCGYSFPYYTDYQLESMRRKALIRMIVTGAVFLLYLFLLASV